MSISILSRTKHIKGELVAVQVDQQSVTVLFLAHAEERINKWQLKAEHVIETLLMPEEVLIGHRNRFIAHRRYGSHLVRAIYEYEAGMPVLLTVYFPFAERYFQGGGVYEDKILKGR